MITILITPENNLEKENNMIIVNCLDAGGVDLGVLGSKSSRKRVMPEATMEDPNSFCGIADSND